MTREQLITAIEAFADAQGIAPATVTSRAVANSRLYHRLKAGGSCSLDIAQKLLGYINQATQAVAAAVDNSDTTTTHDKERGAA